MEAEGWLLKSNFSVRSDRLAVREDSREREEKERVFGELRKSC